MLPGNNQSASRIRQLQFITFTVRLILEIYRRNDSKISNKAETGLPFYLAPSQQPENMEKLKKAKENASCTQLRG